MRDDAAPRLVERGFVAVEARLRRVVRVVDARTASRQSVSSTVWKRKSPRTFGWQNTSWTACR